MENKFKKEEQEYFKWEEKLWTLYHSIFKDAVYTITDGVIFPDKYASTPFKVMIMNREPYDSQKYHTVSTKTDLKDRLKKESVPSIAKLFYVPIHVNI